MSRKKKQEPKIAPGLNTSEPIEEKATKAEKERGDTTKVTGLFIDRTPND